MSAWWSPTEVASLRRRLDEKTVPEPNSGCWLFDGALHRDGHGCIGGPGSKKLYAHRAAWVLANGDVPAGLVVCHRCDVAACVNPAHMFLGTHRDNAMDAVAKGRNVWGEQVGCAKLTCAQVNEIKHRCAEAQRTGLRHWGARKIAAEFGVSDTTVARIATGVTWRRLAFHARKDAA
jgi:hypothetical protein